MSLSTTKTVVLRVQALLANALNSRTLSGGRFSWTSVDTVLETDIVLVQGTTVTVPVQPSQFIFLRTDSPDMIANVKLNNVTLAIPFTQTMLLTNDFTQPNCGITLTNSSETTAGLIRILAA